MTREEILRMLKISYLWTETINNVDLTPNQVNDLYDFQRDVKTVLVHEGLIKKNELN